MLPFSTVLLFTLRRIGRDLVPLPENRERLTWSTLPNAFAYIIPLLFMGYLTRRRDTKLIRLLLLPTVIFTALKGTYGYGGHDPRYNFFTWVRGLGGLVAIATSIDYAFVEGRYKVGETSLPAINEPPSVTQSIDSDSDEDADEKPPNRVQSGLLPLAIIDAVEVCSSLRGIGWDFGKDVFVPQETRPLEKIPFLKATFIRFLKNYLVADFCEATFKLLPGIGSPYGGSMFYSHLPTAHRYIVSTAIQILAGATLIPGFELLYSLMTLIAVGILNQSPKSWPPLIMNPWAADSLHEFWAKRWHQALRRTFLVFGGIPGQWIAGRVGLVLGTFLASGLVHEGGSYLLGKGLDHRVTIFFALQGVGILVEKAFTKTTGKRVGGFFGRLWAYSFVAILGQMCMDAWFNRGLAGAIIIPTALSPARLVFFPLIQRLLR